MTDRNAGGEGGRVTAATLLFVPHNNLILFIAPGTGGVFGGGDRPPRGLVSVQLQRDSLMAPLSF